MPRIFRTWRKHWVKERSEGGVRCSEQAPTSHSEKPE